MNMFKIVNEEGEEVEFDHLISRDGTVFNYPTYSVRIRTGWDDWCVGDPIVYFGFESVCGMSGIEGANDIVHYEDVDWSEVC